MLGRAVCWRGVRECRRVPLCASLLHGAQWPSTGAGRAGRGTRGYAAAPGASVGASTGASVGADPAPQQAAPASRLAFLAAMVPGESAVAKAAYAAVGGGVATLLVTQGIYIPNDETLVLVAFALTTRALYVKLAGPVGAYLQASINVRVWPCARPQLISL